MAQKQTKPTWMADRTVGLIAVRQAFAPALQNAAQPASMIAQPLQAI
jgi:hypothetical protein